MNKNANDKFDIMLKNYCERKSQIAFDVNLEKEHKSKRSRYFAPAVATALVLVLTIGILIISPAIKNEDAKVPTGFAISASASEREAVQLKNVEVELCSKEEKGLISDIVLENGFVAMEPICFNMSGDEVETFDYKCDNGLLYYVIPELKEQMQTDENSNITQNDYFQMGKELKNIPYKSDPNYIFVAWYSNEKIDDEAQEYFKEDVAQIPAEDLQNFRAERLKTAQDFTYYFGGTITVTAHYKDNTSETAVIEVTIDTHEKDGKIYGNYVLKYK